MITEPGAYVLTGTLTGSVTVKSPSDGKVELVLNNATVSNPDGAAINVLESD